MQRCLRSRNRNCLNARFVQRTGDRIRNVAGALQVKVEIARKAHASFQVIDPLPDCNLQSSQLRAPFRTETCPAKPEKESGVPSPSSVIWRSEPPLHLKVAEPVAELRSAAASSPVTPRVYCPSSVPVAQASCMRFAIWAIATLLTLPDPKNFGGFAVKSPSQLPAW